MHTVYILRSESSGRYYIGYTADLEKRLRHHSSGANRSTRKQGPWALIYSEQFNTKAEAWKRERQIKSYKGGEAFKKLLVPIRNGEVA